MNIPISAAKKIAEQYDYDQVIIIARKVGRNEHVTTYGVNKEHCDIATRCGNFLKYKVVGAGMTREEWLDRCAARYRDLGFMTWNLSRDLADLALQEDHDGDFFEDPEGAADEDMSYWTDDGE